MGKNISVDLALANELFSEKDIEDFNPFLIHSQKNIIERSGTGNEFLGWVDLPYIMLNDKKLFQELEELKNEIQKNNTDVIVMIGIGGSYMGARVIIEAMQYYLPYKLLPIIYLGHHLESAYIERQLKLLENKNYYTIVISKSGTTTEPAIAFRLVREQMKKKYGDAYSQRVITITDQKKGALRKLTNQEGYRSFIVPDDVGGRYSVLSPVGLVPLYLVGIDIRELLTGAYDESKLVKIDCWQDNSAFQYVTMRHLAYQKGKPIELFTSFYPCLFYVAEWWKQLFGESEGKNNLGILPTSAMFTTDLHSLGQYIQEGLRIFFETIISIDNPFNTLTIPSSKDVDDGMEFLAGKQISEINKIAEKATAIAHSDGGVPVIKISIPHISTYYLGALLYFFEYSCALSGYCFQINPFDQPGVEAYKNNMYALLGKPGYEELARKLKKRIEKI
ncbi:MAG: glucose-6-phosphate isomerase [Bacteroidales bacterium]|nr:glucose-6-phosphate isomerase [Bacteroidales bacterium]